MLKKPVPQQTELEMVTLEGLVPKDHLLRKIERVIDFSFIHDRVAGLYCPDNGRPALDPVVMFKALFVGYLFGVRSERHLISLLTADGVMPRRLPAALSVPRSTTRTNTSISPERLASSRLIYELISQVMLPATF